MFTGIVEETGTLRSLSRGSKSCVIHVQCSTVLEDTRIGDSIAVNGICLTVTSMESGGFTADVMNETLSRSSLAQTRPGDPVNLERAMAANGRFGGHIVSGHIDGTGIIREIRDDDNAVWYTVEAPPEILRYVVEKGSIAIDGISLTVARVDDRSFQPPGRFSGESGKRYCRKICAAPAGAERTGRTAQEQNNRGVFKGKWILSTTRLKRPLMSLGTDG